MQKLRKIVKDKRGVLGLDAAKSFVIAILTLAVVAFATIVALSALNNSGSLPAGSLEANQTESILLNVTGGIETLFASANTWFALLAVVIIILIIAIVILAVNRFGGATSERL